MFADCESNGCFGKHDPDAYKLPECKDCRVRSSCRRTYTKRDYGRVPDHNQVAKIQRKEFIREDFR